MKKIFWTSVFWIIVFWWMALYIKRFDQPLANQVSDFLVKDIVEEINEEIDLDENVYADEIVLNDDSDLNGEIMSTNIDENIDEEIEDMIEEENWKNLFNQLDRIEKNIKWQWDEITQINDDWETEISKEEMFDEFKTRYEENK